MINITEKEIMKNWRGNISEPVVSICCITYNHEKYIEETIDSFLMQETNFPFEIVIGDMTGYSMELTIADRDSLNMRNFYQNQRLKINYPIGKIINLFKEE